MRIVHYINQFYAGIGGEDKADTPPGRRDGFVGPGMALNAGLEGAGEIVGTVYCGDGYFNEHQEAAALVLEMIRSYSPDIVVVGPAFNAGRYGMACGAVAKLVDERLHIPVVGGLYEENPGLDIYKRHAFFVSVGDSAATMRKAIPDILATLKQVIAGEEPDSKLVFAKGLRVNYFAKKRGSRRAVEMLLKKIAGDEFVTEYPMPTFDRVVPPPPVEFMKTARIALVSSGGPVPKGNPDRIESSSASKFGAYSLADINDFTPDNGETAHGGYDPVYANLDLDRVLPVDVVKELVAEGEIGSLHEYWYSTVGNGTSVANSKKFAQDIALRLKEDNVSCVILTST
jgi:glycine reductase